MITLSDVSLLLAGMHAAQRSMPASTAFTHWSKNGFLAHYSDKHEIWHRGVDRLPLPNFTFIGAGIWEYNPKTFKIWNFVQKFAPRGDLFAQFLRNSQRLYASGGSF